MPTVSVALATHNGARFLGEQLQSIAEQTQLPLEIVITDDLSTDRTLEIAEDFAQSAPFPIRIYRNAHKLGFVRNFRAAVSHCSGDLIAFCDQDDWWQQTRLETLSPRFDDPELLLLYHNASIVDDQRRELGLLYDAQAEQDALKLEPMGPWNHSYGMVQIFRSELRRFDYLWDESLNHVTEPADILSHDQWYFFLAQALGRVDFLEEPLVQYRQHGANIVGASRARSTIERRLTARLEHHGGQDLRFAKAASARSRILQALADQLPASAPRLHRIAHHYDLLAQRCYKRYQTYCSASFSRRLESLVQSWKAGDYSEWPWGFHRYSAIRDLWSGVLLAKH